MIKNNAQISFTELYMERNTRKSQFFDQLNKLLNWDLIEKEIRKNYQKGVGLKGQPAYSGLSLFKMLLLSHWYALSDAATEEMVKESISCMRFCGFRLEDQIPDHTTLCRFRNELVSKKAYERLLKKINEQLEKHRVIVKTEVMIDASITQSPFSPKGNPPYELLEEEDPEEKSSSTEASPRKEKRAPGVEGANKAREKKYKLIKQAPAGIDTQAKWTKKGRKYYYGYKKHLGVDKNGMVLAVHSVGANEHDSKALGRLIPKLSAKVKEVYADKGYQSLENETYLKTRGIKSRIQKKAYRNNPLSRICILFNKLISKKRWVVERTFGSMKRWFASGKARYKSLARVHAQHVMEAIAHNLYRAPGIIMRSC